MGEADLFRPRYLKRYPVKCTFYYLRSGLSFGGRGARFLKGIRWLLFPFIVWRACVIAKKEKGTYIVGTFPEGFYILLSLVTAMILKLPYSAYFHNTFVENRTGFNRWWANQIQRAVFDRAQHIFVMSDGMKRFYEEQYPDVHKFKSLVHTFNHFPALSQNVRAVTAPPWKVAFTGNFNKSNLEATIRVVEALKQIPDIQLNFYTPVPKSFLKLRGVDTDAITYKGYLADDVYFQELASNDVMILTHGFEGGYSDVEYRTIFPTRTIQMLLTERPIFVHAPADSFLSDYLRAHDFAILVDQKNNALIQQAVKELLTNEALQRQCIENGKKAVAMFYGPTVCRDFKNILIGIGQ